MLSLVEASRFPKMKWKRFMLSSAKLAMRGLDDQHLRSRVAEMECIVYRIDGDIDRATGCLDLTYDKVSSSDDNRRHAATGQNAIQKSLNCIQVEDLSTARKVLEDWSPLDEIVSPLETAVVFRKGIILGRALRYRGDFEGSLTHLKRSQSLAQKSKNLAFDEDIPNLTCELAETFLELSDPVSAEYYLRREIERRAKACHSSSGGSLPDLILAESLFAQGRFGEVESLCSKIQSRTGLLKADQLRFHIIRAKLRHINFDYEKASHYWGKAMEVVNKFPNETCATKIIVQSVCDILGRHVVTKPDREQLLEQSHRNLSSLGTLAKPGGYRCWIAGLRHWVAYLQDHTWRSNL